MTPLIREYPIEIASAAGLFVAGLYWKYGISRLTIWRYLGLCCRAYEAAEVERRRVMAEGTAAVHGAGCVGHLVRRER